MALGRHNGLRESSDVPVSPNGNALSNCLRVSPQGQLPQIHHNIENTENTNTLKHPRNATEAVRAATSCRCIYNYIYVCGYKGGALPDLDLCAICVPCEHGVKQASIVYKQALYYFLLLTIARLWHGPYMQPAVIVLWKIPLLVGGCFIRHNKNMMRQSAGNFTGGSFVTVLVTSL